MPHLEVTEVVLIHSNVVNNDYQHDDVVLIHSNVVNNDYQHDERVLYIFIPNKSFGQSLDVSPKNVMFLKTFIS